MSREKCMKLLRGLTDVREEFLEEMEEAPAKGRRRPVRWIAAAACVCLLAGAALGVQLHRRAQLEHPWPILELPAADGGESQLSEVAEVVPWSELPVYRRYGEIPLNDVLYDAGDSLVPPERLGEKLGDVTARGWDSQAEMAGEPAERLCPAEVCAIRNISPDCAVAVRYEGEDQFRAAVNTLWRPETLGQFIEELNLREELRFGPIYYEYRRPSGEYATIRFYNVPAEKIWELLLSAPEAENVYDQQDFTYRAKILGISVDVPLLGYENISISIHEGGYIRSNILATGKLFQVGEAYTDAFVDYVLTECQGYEIVYVSEDDTGVPEADGALENAAAEEPQTTFGEPSRPPEAKK